MDTVNDMTKDCLCGEFKYPQGDDGGLKCFNEKTRKFFIKEFKRQRLSDHALKTAVEKTSVDNLVKVKRLDYRQINSAIINPCYMMGRYIGREMGYGIMFNTKYICECSYDTWHLYLFMDGNYVIGAVGFVYQEWINLKTLWDLKWVWLHPGYRRNGILSKSWHYFHKLYSPFCIEHPLSDAMESFLKGKEFIFESTTDKKPHQVALY